MTKKLIFTNTTAFILICTLGVLNHFLYSWSGDNPIVGTFTPINESIWEHLKLLFFPFMLYTFAEFVLSKKHVSGFLFSRFLGVLCGMIFIPTAFYCYTFLLGRDLLVLDILIFIAAVALSLKISAKRIDSQSDAYDFLNLSGLILFIGVTALFIGFTFYPPNTPLFDDNM